MNPIAGLNGDKLNAVADELNLTSIHLLNLTDDTGIFQHCRYSIPDRNYGYTLDDNARALIVAARSTNPTVQLRLPTYLSFVMYCQRPDGLFRNFMSYERQFLENVGSPDSQGRVLWALGVLYQEQSIYRDLVEEMLNALIPHLNQLQDLRCKAFAILGLHFYLQINPNNAKFRFLLEKLSDELVQSWQSTSSQNADWQWFEGHLTYENARLPQALFAAYISTGRKIYLTISGAAASFLEKTLFSKGYLKLIGNQGWLFYGGQSQAAFDEQPVDAGALVEMYAMAYFATGKVAYAKLAKVAFNWYKGHNCHGLVLIDTKSGGCYDGLTAKGFNLNQGSESVLSYQMAFQSLLSGNAM